MNEQNEVPPVSAEQAKRYLAAEREGERPPLTDSRGLPPDAEVDATSLEDVRGWLEQVDPAMLEPVSVPTGRGWAQRLPVRWLVWVREYQRAALGRWWDEFVAALPVRGCVPGSGDAVLLRLCREEQWSALRAGVAGQGWTARAAGGGQHPGGVAWTLYTLQEFSPQDPGRDNTGLGGAFANANLGAAPAPRSADGAVPEVPGIAWLAVPDEHWEALRAWVGDVVGEVELVEGMTVVPVAGVRWLALMLWAGEHGLVIDQRHLLTRRPGFTPVLHRGCPVFDLCTAEQFVEDLAAARVFAEEPEVFDLAEADPPADDTPGD